MIHAGWHFISEQSGYSRNLIFQHCSFCATSLLLPGQTRSYTAICSTPLIGNWPFKAFDRKNVEKKKRVENNPCLLHLCYQGRNWKSSSEGSSKQSAVMAVSGTSHRSTPRMFQLNWGYKRKNLHHLLSPSALQHFLPVNVTQISHCFKIFVSR